MASINSPTSPSDNGKGFALGRYPSDPMPLKSQSISGEGSSAASSSSSSHKNINDACSRIAKYYMNLGGVDAYNNEVSHMRDVFERHEKEFWGQHEITSFKETFSNILKEKNKLVQEIENFSRAQFYYYVVSAPELRRDYFSDFRVLADLHSHLVGNLGVPFFLTAGLKLGFHYALRQSLLQEPSLSFYLPVDLGQLRFCKLGNSYSLLGAYNLSESQIPAKDAFNPVTHDRTIHRYVYMNPDTGDLYKWSSEFFNEEENTGSIYALEGLDDQSIRETYVFKGKKYLPCNLNEVYGICTKNEHQSWTVKFTTNNHTKFFDNQDDISGNLKNLKSGENLIIPASCLLEPAIDHELKNFLNEDHIRSVVYWDPVSKHVYGQHKGEDCNNLKPLGSGGRVAADVHHYFELERPGDKTGSAKRFYKMFDSISSIADWVPLSIKLRALVSQMGPCIYREEYVDFTNFPEHLLCEYKKEPLFDDLFELNESERAEKYMEAFKLVKKSKFIEKYVELSKAKIESFNKTYSNQSENLLGNENKRSIRLLVDIDRVCALSEFFPKVAAAFALIVRAKEVVGLTISGDEHDPFIQKVKHLQLEMLKFFRDASLIKVPEKNMAGHDFYVFQPEMSLHQGEYTEKVSGHGVNTSEGSLTPILDAANADAKRIGHALLTGGMANTAKLVKLFKEKNIYVEICPSSTQTLLNIPINKHPVLINHELRQLTVVGSDDAGMFKTNIQSEYGSYEFARREIQASSPEAVNEKAKKKSLLSMFKNLPETKKYKFKEAEEHLLNKINNPYNKMPDFDAFTDDILRSMCAGFPRGYGIYNPSSEGCYDLLPAFESVRDLFWNPEQVFADHSNSSLSDMQIRQIKAERALVHAKIQNYALAIVHGPNGLGQILEKYSPLFTTYYKLRADYESNKSKKSSRRSHSPPSSSSSRKKGKGNSPLIS